MNFKLIGLACISVVFFTFAGVIEWRYYTGELHASHSTNGALEVNSLPGGRSSRKADAGASRQSLQKLLEADLASLPDTPAAPQGNSASTHFVSKGSVSPAPDIPWSVALATAGDASIPRGTVSGDARAHNLSKAAIILFCYNRTKYLNQTLASLAELPGLHQLSVYISQDGADAGVSDLVQAYAGLLQPPRTAGFEHWQHPRVPLLGQKQAGHAWLTQHYKWGLDKLFLERNHSHAIIVEDDMLFSQDFLMYFQATAPLLDADPSLWCVSTWNDNCLDTLEWENRRLFRTSYFPGLGWMLRRELWQELGPKFPLQAWDHWMRLDSIAKGRECIVPEVNRNKNIGMKGANMQTSVFKRYLANMLWSQEPVAHWGDLSYLLLETYTTMMRAAIQAAKLWDQPMSLRAVAAATPGQMWLMPYKIEDYLKVARMFRIWPYPRGHHRNLLIMPVHGSRFLLADQRFCPLLPDQLKVLPSPTLQPTAAAVGKDCIITCKEKGLECVVGDFWFINSCEELQKHFPCERGCAVELGFDVPNYVASANLSTYQTCLVTQKEPRCRASHPATARLCPCSAQDVPS